MKEYDLSSLKNIGSGAAPLSKESEDELRGQMSMDAIVRQGTYDSMVAVNNIAFCSTRQSYTVAHIISSLTDNF